MTTPAIAVVGYSNSGKTTVASSLIALLTGRGYRIGAIKHCPHGFEPGREGSDTDRLSKAGAAWTIAVSPEQAATTGDTDAPIDLVVMEGFKASKLPKILVSNGPTSPAVRNVVAVVGDHVLRADAPAYPAGELDGLVDQIEREFLLRLLACQSNRAPNQPG